MQATRIIAVRHGETHWNVDARIQGQRDIPLNDKGRWQAQRLARALSAREPITAVYSSDLARARQTAQAVAEVAGLQVLDEPALRERGFGTFEGRTFVELEAEVPHETARWRRREADWAPEGGETLTVVRARVEKAVHALGARHVGEQIVLVSHGGVLDVLYRVAAGLAIDAPRSWVLGNASINRLLWTPQGLSLVGWSDTAHLEDAWTDETTV